MREIDVGNYTCVAENIVNRRLTSPARIQIFGQYHNKPDKLTPIFDMENPPTYLTKSGKLCFENPLVDRYMKLNRPARLRLVKENRQQREIKFFQG